MPETALQVMQKIVDFSLPHSSQTLKQGIIKSLKRLPQGSPINQSITTPDDRPVLIFECSPDPHCPDRSIECRLWIGDDAKIHYKIIGTGISIIGLCANQKAALSLFRRHLIRLSEIPGFPYSESTP